MAGVDGGIISNPEMLYEGKGEKGKVGNRREAGRGRGAQRHAHHHAVRNTAETDNYARALAASLARV